MFTTGRPKSALAMRGLAAKATRVLRSNPASAVGEAAAGAGCAGATVAISHCSACRKR